MNLKADYKSQAPVELNAEGEDNLNGTSNSSWDSKLPIPNLSWPLSAALVASVAIFCFKNSLDAEFVFDDSEAIVNNADVRPENSVWNVFYNDFWGTRLTHKTSHKSYRPITVLSFRMNFFLCGGLKAWGFHLTNIVLHAIVSMLLIPVYSLLLGGNCPRVAFLGSLLFAVHPVHTEAVAGVVGRADLLCSLFYLLSFLAYCKATSYKELHSKILCLIASVVLCVISTFCKEQGITVLGLCSIYDIVGNAKILPADVNLRLTQRISLSFKRPWILLNLSSTNEANVTQRKTSVGGNNRELLQRHVVLFLTGLALLLLRWKIMGSALPTFQKFDNPASFAESIITRVLSYNYIYAINMWLLLCPEWLCFDWSMGCIPLISIANGFDYRIIVVLLFWCLLGILLWRCLSITDRRNSRCLIMCLTLLIVPFLPASNLFFRVGFVVAERVLYLPSAGFCMFVAVAIRKMATLDRYIAQVGCFCLLVALSARAIHRTADWKTEDTLFTSGLNVCPLNAKIYYNIAKRAGDAGNKETAVTAYRKAISLNGEYDQAMNNLANILKAEGNLEEAETLLRKAISLRHDFAAARMNLGIVLASQKQYQAAEQSYLTALQYRKIYPDCYYNLGNLYLEQKLYNAAFSAWKNATKQKPTHRLAWNNMVMMLNNLGILKEAAVVAEEALTILPEDPQLHFTLGNVLGKDGKYDVAEKHFQKAIDLEPSNALYISNLGILYHRWKKYTSAEIMYKKALSIDPNLSSAKDNLVMLKRNNHSSDMLLGLTA